MMKKLRSILLAILPGFLLFTGVNSYAQPLNNTLLFGAEQRFDPEELRDYLESQSRQVSSWEIDQVFRNPSIFRLRGNLEQVPDLEKWLTGNRQVHWFAQDQLLKNRVIPDDPFLNEQWHLDQIAAYDAWNITHGGVTPLGDTIVIAVLDDGFYTAHSDLKANIWKNFAEIPGDQIDNDGNGYVDDFAGLNMQTGNDAHAVKKHGTAVAGIIGAEGNNGVGGTGVSWNVRLLLISEANNLGNLIEAYQYILDMRRKYTESGGTAGAYIVATNLSAGIDGVFPDDDPIFTQWCNLYNTHGEEGIINVNATTNSDSNIDVEGDMPGTCPSDFLIITTNSDRQDNKVKDAGYGLNSVDLSAPGEDIFTISLADEYATFNGASSSAPQVTGTIALLYAAPCMDFALLSKQDPQAAALEIKKMILNGVDQNPGLESLVKSGGRLNALSAMASLRDFCEGTTGDLEIKLLSPNPAKTYLELTYETENYEAHSIELYNALGQLVYRQSIRPDFFGDKLFRLDLTPLNLATGVYFLTLESPTERKTVSLLISK